MSQLLVGFVLTAIVGIVALGLIIGSVYVALARSPLGAGGVDGWRYPLARPFAIAGLIGIPTVLLVGLGALLMQQLTSAQPVFFRDPVTPRRTPPEVVRISPTRYATSNVEYERGLRLYEQGRYAEAIAAFEQALRLQPDFAAAYSARGSANYYAGQYERALNDFQQALDLGSVGAQEYRNRGLAYYSLERYPQALADYNSALKLAPDSVDALINRGYVYYSTDDAASALVDFDRAINLSPDRADAYYGRGLVYARLNQADLALADFTTYRRFNTDPYWDEQAQQRIDEIRRGIQLP